MSKPKAKKNVDVETVEIPVPVETPVEEKVIVYIGTIRDCDKLNVREEPTADAKVICKLDKTSEVQVDKAASTKEFYKIHTAAGVSGYCMKKFMSVKKQEV